MACREQIVEAVLGGTPSVPGDLFSRLDEARGIYVEEAGRRRVYGYCGGLGDLAGREGRCGHSWEERVLEEHSVGVGPRAPEWMVRGFLAARLLQLTPGQAPVRGTVARRILEALEADVVPEVPLYGSVGASGDLAPSAHAFLCLYYGRGWAWRKGRRLPCSDALAEAGLEPLPLEPGEALALINNTAWSTMLAAIGLEAAWRALDYWLEASRRSLVEAQCNGEHYDPQILESRSHVGVAKAAGMLRVECGGSRMQDPYSLRCTPMVAGAALEALEWASSIVEKEACAPTENPTVYKGRVWHWCGFHAIYPAMAADVAALAIAHLVGVSERRIAQLLRGEVTGLPDYLAVEGSPVGAMIAQYAAASIAGRARWLSAPASVHSIPTSGLQEDYVSMAPNAGLRLLEASATLALVSALELAVGRAARVVRGGSQYSIRRLVEEAVEEVSRDPVLRLVTSWRPA